MFLFNNGIEFNECLLCSCWSGFAPFGRTSVTSAGHHRPVANRHSAGAGAFFSHPVVAYESELSTLRQNTKKAQPFGLRFAFGSDSVGIRTQDPQLRRLLLYPTELPNRSLCFLTGKRVLCPKEGAKIVIIF